MTSSVRMDVIDHIIDRLEENKQEAEKENKADRNDLFSSGRLLAYEEVIDIIKSEIKVNCD